MAEVPIYRISTLGFVQEFRRQHDQQPDAPFLFILGSGASRSTHVSGPLVTSVSAFEVPILYLDSSGSPAFPPVR